MAFLKDADYSVLIRKEIKDIITESEYTDTSAEAKISAAESMAIQQVKNYLAGRYDTAMIFEPLAEEATVDTRNAHIVMLTIDCTLYHLYTSLAPNLIPDHRSTRYQDALDWLKGVGTGEMKADLPRYKDADGEEKFDFRISSERENEDNKW